MTDLLSKKCVPCEGGILPFDVSEIHKYQKKVDGWDVKKSIKEKIYLHLQQAIFKSEMPYITMIKISIGRIITY